MVKRPNHPHFFSLLCDAKDKNTNSQRTNPGKSFSQVKIYESRWYTQKLQNQIKSQAGSRRAETILKSLILEILYEIWNQLKKERKYLEMWRRDVWRNSLPCVCEWVWGEILLQAWDLRKCEERRGNWEGFNGKRGEHDWWRAPMPGDGSGTWHCTLSEGRASSLLEVGTGFSLYRKFTWTLFLVFIYRRGWKEFESGGALVPARGRHGGWCPRVCGAHLDKIEDCCVAVLRAGELS